MNKRLFLLTSGIFIFAGCNRILPQRQEQVNPVRETQQVDSKLKAVYEFIAEEDGQVALDLLAGQAEIETTDYGSAGQFVTSINGLAGSNEYYWAFYLNGAYAEQGASQTVLQKGDTIRFVYEAVTLSN